LAPAADGRSSIGTKQNSQTSIIHKGEVMNPRTIAAASIALNIILLAVLLLRPAASSSPPDEDAAPESRSRTALPAAPLPPDEPEMHAIQPAATPIDWRKVESDDYRTYIANLRAIGCPEETIRDIIRADVQKLFDSQEKGHPRQEFKFWETGMKAFANLMNPDDIARRQELAQERRALLKDLLGEDYIEPPQALLNEQAMMEALLGFLPPEKQQQAIEIEQKYAAELMKNMSALPDPDVMGKVMAEKEAELARLLSPAEFDQYQLTLSPLSMMMRMEMDGFDPTEEEFRRIFAIRNELEGSAAMFGGGRDQETRQTVQQEVQAYLGPERWAEYERATDFEYKMISNVATKHALPRETAVQVYDIRQVAQTEAHQIRANAQLDAEQKEQALSAVQRETESTIRSVLGDPAFNDYEKHGGHWIKGLGR
jgi:hypothetical protein